MAWPIAMLFWLSSLAASARADDPKGTKPASALPPPALGSVSFAKDIEPILRNRCHQCHGPRIRKGGLRLDDRSAMLTGGDSGPAIVIGKSGESLIIEKTSGLEPSDVMPPPGKGERLTAEQVGRLRAWIDQGALWSDAASSAAAEPARSNQTHWAFQPIRRVRPPSVKRADWARNPIDAFILRKLEAESFAPSPEAERAVLIRRLSLDLLGLLPTVADVDAFVNDPAPDAYEKVVDRYLASPHYGERWGRHWLDLARYADSDGYEKDLPRPWAWRYRDWVIKALNEDMPFDQFTIEQLAGDLVPNAGWEQRLATGFHRNTLTNREGGVDQEEYRVAATIDRANTTATVWLGLTMGCAQCHSHKYDPISQREYYRLFAFFNESDELDLDAPMMPNAGAGVEAEVKAQPKPKPKADAEAKAKAKKAKAADESPKIMTIGKLKSPRTTHVLQRGDFLQPGDEVRPGVPEVFPPLKTADGQPPTRLDLAYWLTDPANPLTARVTVNRIWAHLFGRGLAMPLNDLGTQGEPPSHPELLDWLASELVREGWSQKRLIRRIATSSTYRQSSRHLPALIDRDPKNLWLARQNRLRVTAEAVRDLALDASGQLSRKLGGPSVRPPLPSGMAELGYAGSVKWTESQGEDKRRRGVYTFFQRTVPYPMLMTFDAPDSNVVCARRERSNTPLQALTLLNDPVFVECARGLGLRALKEGPAADSQRLQWMFRVCLARTPSPQELERLSALLRESKRACAESPDDARALLAGEAIPEASGVSPPDAAAWIALARILLNLDEFTTRE